MARAAPIARDPSDPQTRWIQRKYPDHQGNTVILGKEDYEHQFFTPVGTEACRLQIYSTIPIKPDDLVKLYEYSCFEIQLKPFLEIYSYNPPDPLTCIENQQREFAYRKQLHASPRESHETHFLLCFRL